MVRLFAREVRLIPSLDLKRLYRRAYFGVQDTSRTVRHAFAARIPATWVPRSRGLASQLTIGITTYEARYDQYFRPLLDGIKDVFEDINVLVAVNGSCDMQVQTQYIERLVKDCSAMEKVNFLVHSEVVGLSRMWNEIACHSPAPNILILNDDLTFDPWFRVCLKKAVAGNRGVTTVNGSWSHFLLTLDCYRQVGPFDEGFVGIGFEDIDYMLRANQKGLYVQNLVSREIRNLDDRPETTSYDHVSGRVWGKFTKSNEIHFMKKYKILNDDDEEIPLNATFVKQFGRYVVPRAVSDEGGEDGQSAPQYELPFCGFVAMDENACETLNRIR